jgi:hypothetical protein
MNDQVNDSGNAASSRSVPNLGHLAARMRLITLSLAENDTPGRVGPFLTWERIAIMAGTPSESWHSSAVIFA